MPKRKHHEIVSEDSVDSEAAVVSTGDDSSLSGSLASENSCEREPPGKKRRSVNFQKVDVFYFPRTQGFACVPSQGGTTLGMTKRHAHKEEYDINHYRKLRKLVRRKKSELEETAENSFNIDSINEISHDEIIQTDSEEDDTETDGFFLQPVPTKLRRSLLKLSGVKKLDISERDECKELRGSREQCGCECQTECHPDTCQCALNGIQCQVDRFSFPCGCTKKGCANPSGRIEFNPGKVQKHYQHTMSRLRQESEAELSGSKPQQATSLAKKPRHVRFTDEDELVEGEISFNSTDTGCCLDCSLTTAPVTTGNPYAAQLSVHSSSSSVEKLDNQFSVFGTSVLSPESNTSAIAELPIVCADTNKISTSLEPISGLLNPILNTVDSLDMYALAHLHNNSTTGADSNGGDFHDDSVTEWQTLSHESLLTTNNLIPMKDEDSCSGSSSAQSEPVLDSDILLQHFPQSDDQQTQPLSFQFNDENLLANVREKSENTGELVMLKPTINEASL